MTKTLQSLASSLSANKFLDASSVSPDLATERELHFTTGKRAKRSKLDFRFPISRSAIGQAICLICTRRRQMTFPFFC